MRPAVRERGSGLREGSSTASSTQITTSGTCRGTCTCTCICMGWCNSVWHRTEDTCSHKSNQGFQDFLLGGELLCIAMSGGGGGGGGGGGMPSLKSLQTTAL